MAKDQGPTAKAKGPKAKDDAPKAKETAPAQEPTPAPLNRQQRRRQKFGHAPDRRQDNLQLQSQNNTAFTNPVRPDREEGPREAIAVSANQGPSDMTGPGTGGATEEEGQTPHHPGVHVSRSTKG